MLTINRSKAHFRAAAWSPPPREQERLRENKSERASERERERGMRNGE